MGSCGLLWTNPADSAYRDHSSLMGVHAGQPSPSVRLCGAAQYFAYVLPRLSSGISIPSLHAMGKVRMALAVRPRSICNGKRERGMLGVDRPLGHRLEDIHETIGTIGYYLIGLHALAALFHHYIVRDDTLRRMLP